MQIQVETASVKVMRSHDYCHFEVCLSSSLANTPELVDELRKTAARLADKAVEQYKVAKANAQAHENDSSQLASLLYRHSDILKKPESERTPEEKATVKTIEDRKHRSRRFYSYEDEWSEPDYSADDSEY